jgi:hypothetical protein
MLDPAAIPAAVDSLQLPSGTASVSGILHKVCLLLFAHPSS